MALQPSGSNGLATGSKTLIVFMLGFVFLGYSVFLSICLGLVAGMVSGFISAWWNAKDDYTTPEPRSRTQLPHPEEELAPITRPFARSRKTPGFGVTPARKKRRYRTQGQRRFGWLFRKDKDSKKP
jgi:hypothetical protein